MRYFIAILITAAVTVATYIGIDVYQNRMSYKSKLKQASEIVHELNNQSKDFNKTLDSVRDTRNAVTQQVYSDLKSQVSELPDMKNFAKRDEPLDDKQILILNAKINEMQTAVGSLEVKMPDFDKNFKSKIKF